MGNEQALGFLITSIIGIALWIIFVINSRIIAGQLNRDKNGWTIFAVFFPILAIIILGLILKPKRQKGTPSYRGN